MNQKHKPVWPPLLVAGLLALARGPGAFGQCGTYTMTQSTGAAIVPGTADTLIHCDDCTANIALPFTVTIFDASYTTVNACSNGNLQFTTANAAFSNTCLPDAATGAALHVHWDDLRTDAAGDGVFTSVSGSAPTRVLNIEWRSHLYINPASAARFQVRLYEDQSRVEFVYGTVSAAGVGATVGIQPAPGGGPPIQFECGGGGLSAGLMITFAANNDPMTICGTGACSPASVDNCGDAAPLLAVRVLPASPPSTDPAVAADLSSIGESAAQAFYDDGTHGDAAAGDGTFSFRATIPLTVPAGSRSLPFTLSDGQGRTGGGSINMMVTACPPLGGVGSASPDTAHNCGGAFSLLSVLVTPGSNPSSTGITVAADLSSIGGPSAQEFYDDGTHGDAAAGDNRFSFRAVVAANSPTGSRILPVQIADAQSRTASAAIPLSVSPCPTSGPDVYVGDLTDVGIYGTIGAVTAYAVGTNACNAGDAPVDWINSGPGTANHHPVIAQDFFRFLNGRFEQLGQSWLKHGFASTNSGFCGVCTQPPLGGRQLGVGCSDAYGAGLNGGQSGLGPRSQVNATTGDYPFPFSAPPAAVTIGRRLQVYTGDVDPALNAGAEYFAEAHYVTYDDARWSDGPAPAINGLNNSTYRRILIPSTAAAPTFADNAIHTQSYPVQAWRDQDSAVQIASADYIDATLGAPGIVARFVIGCRVSINGDGTYHYEYAVYNHNADRAGGSFSIPIPAGVAVGNIGFHGVFAHSGEPYPNTAADPDNWVGLVSSGAVTWSAPETYVPPTGDNGNALRWGTMYNFRFDASTPPAPPPASGQAILGLWKPGDPASVTAAVQVPSSPPCRVDFNGDGAVNVQDYLAFLAAYSTADPRCDLDGNGQVNVQDYLAFLAAYSIAC